MTTENKAAFARRLNWNRSTVTRAAQAGRLVMAGNLVDVEASLARLKATEGGRTDVAARHAAERAQAVPQPTQKQKNGTAATKTPSTPADAADHIPETPGDTDGGSRARYKAMVLHYENQQLKLGMALARGLRFNRKDAARESGALGGIIRSAIERVIDQTAPRLAVMTAADPRRALLGTELRAIRRTLRGEFPRALRRLRSASQKGAA
jgi:pyruvate/2-oxoglutarate dehydrogenase complex dihydrolipoamide acyltransferase (E2) component